MGLIRRSHEGHAVVGRDRIVDIGEHDVLTCQHMVVDDALDARVELGIFVLPGIRPIEQVRGRDGGIGAEALQRRKDGVHPVDGSGGFAVVVDVIVAPDVERDVVGIQAVARLQPEAAVGVRVPSVGIDVLHQIAGGITRVPFVEDLVRAD